MFLIAPVTGVWGSLMFGEPLTVHTLTGLTLALVAAAVVTTDRHATARRPVVHGTSGPSRRVPAWRSC
jgi:hypothetical protein